MQVCCLCPPGVVGRMGANALLRGGRHYFLLEEITEDCLGEMTVELHSKIGMLQLCRDTNIIGGGNWRNSSSKWNHGKEGIVRF